MAAALGPSALGEPAALGSSLRHIDGHADGATLATALAAAALGAAALQLVEKRVGLRARLSLVIAALVARKGLVSKLAGAQGETGFVLGRGKRHCQCLCEEGEVECV